MKKLVATLALFCVSFADSAVAMDSSSVMSQDKWFVHVGGAWVNYVPAFNNFAGGPPGPRGLRIGDNFTGVIEAGRYVTPNIAFAVAAGIPPTANVDLTVGGAFAGNIGKVTFGSVMLLGQYHFNSLGAIKPYIGAGAAYNITLSTTPGPVAAGRLDVANGFGAVLQAGVEADVANNVGVFLDVKKMFASTDVTIAPAVVSNVRFNPWIVSAGVSFRF